MALSEIEKLERRYAENPQGLTFAPLAEVHRKNGEVRRALDLLGPGLEIHPDYIPASIVLGRCHMDLGDVHAAETAFLHVLALDGENVIALKALADISERLLKFDEAERWLQTLLSVDRSNDDAREQLQRVEVSRRQAEVASSAEPSSVSETQTDLEPAERPDAAREAGRNAARSASTAPGASRPASRTRVELPRLRRASRTRSTLEEPPIELDDLVETFGDLGGARGPAVEPIDGLIGREVDSSGSNRIGDFRVETSRRTSFSRARAEANSRCRTPRRSSSPVAPARSALRSRRMPRSLRAPRGKGRPKLRSRTSGIQRGDDDRRGVSHGIYSAPEPTAPEPAAAEAYAPELSPRSRSCPNPPRRSRPRRSRLPSRTSRTRASRTRTARIRPARTRVDRRPCLWSGGLPVRSARLRIGTRLSLPPRRRSARTAWGRLAVGRSSISSKASSRPGPPCRPRPPRSGRPLEPAAPARPPGRPPTHSRSARFSARRPRKRHPPFRPPTRGLDRSPSTISSPPRAPHPRRTPRAPDPKSDDLDQFHAWLQNLKR